MYSLFRLGNLKICKEENNLVVQCEEGQEFITVSDSQFFDRSKCVIVLLIAFVQELDKIESAVKDYESKARNICGNIQCENGTNDNLVANFEEFIRNWEKHIQLKEDK